MWCCAWVEAWVCAVYEGIGQSVMERISSGHAELLLCAWTPYYFLRTRQVRTCGKDPEP